MKAQIYINHHIVQANKKTLADHQPAITINTYLGSLYAKEVEFTGAAKLIQDESNARCSGATIWVEVPEFTTLVIDGVKAHRGMFKGAASKQSSPGT
jgi:hypothetical protein